MMKVSGFACAILMVLYALPLPAFHLAFNFQDMNVRRMTSAMQKIFKHSSPPAFLLGDSGSKGHLPPPPSEASLINNLGDKSNSVLVTLIAGTNETIGTKHHGLKKNIKITPLRSIRDWWKEQSKGRSGILVALLPALLVQLHMFTTAAPFVIELLTQYLNPPLALLTALALLRPINGVSFLQRTLWVSMAVGALYMMYDTFSAGASWSPLQPAEDSYAVITG